MQSAIRAIIAAFCLLLMACARQHAEQPNPQASSLAAAAAAREQAQAQVLADLGRLRAALDIEVPGHTRCGGKRSIVRLSMAQAALAASSVTIDRPQMIVLVDRDPEAQKLCLVLAQPGQLWQAIGGSQVSTGQAGRRGYFITPTGVFVHSTAILDYRAEGTFNEKHIRGLGLKGMRVWDFGWQKAEKGWSADGEPGEIRLLMHATDPDYLEERLGRPASQGCIHISAAMNRFLDRHGVLDASHERAAASDERFRVELGADREPTSLAGDLLVVVDSSATGSMR